MSATALTLQTIPPENPAYPAALKTCAAFKTAPILTAIGAPKLLEQNAMISGRSKTIALFCSVQCPGDFILKTYHS